MMTLCFVGGKERQKSRIMRDVFKNNVASVSHCISLLCRVIASGFRADMALFLA